MDHFIPKHYIIHNYVGKVIPWNVPSLEKVPGKVDEQNKEP